MFIIHYREHLFACQLRLWYNFFIYNIESRPVCQGISIHFAVWYDGGQKYQKVRTRPQEPRAAGFHTEKQADLWPLEVIQYDR